MDATIRRKTVLAVALGMVLAGTAGCPGGKSAVKPGTAGAVAGATVGGGTTGGTTGGTAGGTTGGTGAIGWSARPSPGTHTVTGSARGTGYRAPPPSYAVTSVDPVSSTTAAVTIRYDSAGGVTAITLEAPDGTRIFRWDEAAGDSIVETGDEVMASDSAQRNFLYGIDPTGAVGWEYQTVAAWLTGFGTGSGGFGAASIGWATAGGAVPVTGTAVFSGKLVGGYVDSAGDAYRVTGDVRVDVDFAARRLQLRTSGTRAMDLATGATTAMPGLDLSGTLAYSAGSGTFTGALSSAGGMAGDASGTFYGPAAEELGGTFGLKGAAGSPETYVGAFGAKR